MAASSLIPQMKRNTVFAVLIATYTNSKLTNFFNANRAMGGATEVPIATHTKYTSFMMLLTAVINGNHVMLCYFFQQIFFLGIFMRI